MLVLDYIVIGNSIRVCPGTSNMPNIFEYTNFREYLKDFFNEEKKDNPVFSHRHLARKLGLSTPNLILLIMQGKRNLTRTVRYTLSKYLKLSNKESKYFTSMILFMQAKTHDEKNIHFMQMLDLRKNLKIGKMEEHQFEYYSNWYNPVIRELVTHPDFNYDDYNWLAKSIIPSISPAQAKRSVELLLRLALIKKKGNGYIQTDSLISTGPEVNSLAVVNFHKKTAELAKESFDRFTLKERTVTSCTVNFTEEHFNELKREIADLRQKALSLAMDLNNSTRVYQMNIHLFPLTKRFLRRKE